MLMAAEMTQLARQNAMETYSLGSWLKATQGTEGNTNNWIGNIFLLIKQSHKTNGRLISPKREYFSPSKIQIK